ncbi:hypothetical protein Tco_0139540 [Tanacetum coccineum]
MYPIRSSFVEDDDEVSLNDDDDDVANQDHENQDDDNEQTNSDNDGDDFVHPKFSTYDDDAKQDEEVNEEDSFDPREEERVEEATHEEDDVNELYRDINVNLEGRDTVIMDAPLPNVQATQEIEYTHVILTALINPEDVSVTTIAEPPLVFATNLPPPPTPLITHMPQTPVPTPTTILSSSLQNLLNFGSLFGFDHRLKRLETNFSEFKQMNQFPEASDRLREEAQAENEDFLDKLDDNIKKIIKDQVKEQVKAQVSKILLKIEKLVNVQPESEVLIRSSNKAKTSHAVAANLSELELKKILIDKMEANKSINRSDILKNLYKALVDAYDADKDILDAYGDTVTIKQFQPWLINLAWEEGPRESFDELMDIPLDFSAFMMNRLKIDTLTPELLADPIFKLMKVVLMNFCHKTERLADYGVSDLTYLSGGVSSRTYATSVTKTKAADYGHIKWIEDLVPNTIWNEVPVNYDKHALWGISHWGSKRQQFYGFVANRELAHDVYSKRRIINVTKLQIVKWHGYKHLDWITVCRDDNKLYTFKEGDFKQLRLQDIEDMLILLVQSKLTNLNVEDRLAFGVSLRIFTRSIIIQRRVEDLQLGIESYQNKLNITKPDTYRSDLKQKDAYTAYSYPRGFIYQNKDKKNILMRIDELYKFSDGTLDDVQTALNDRLKGIRMEYLPKTI